MGVQIAESDRLPRSPPCGVIHRENTSKAIFVIWSVCPLQTGCSRSGFAREWQRSLIADVRWSHSRETGVPQYLPDGDEQTAIWSRFIQVIWLATASADRDGSLPTLQRHPLGESRRREADGRTTVQGQPSEPHSVAELQQLCKQTFRSRGFALLPRD